MSETENSKWDLQSILTPTNVLVTIIGALIVVIYSQTVSRFDRLDHNIQRNTLKIEGNHDEFANLQHLFIEIHPQQARALLTVTRLRELREVSADEGLRVYNALNATTLSGLIAQGIGYDELEVLIASDDNPISSTLRVEFPQISSAQVEAIELTYIAAAQDIDNRNLHAAEVSAMWDVYASTLRPN